MRIHSHFGDYRVFSLASLQEALFQAGANGRLFYLVDRNLYTTKHRHALPAIGNARVLLIQATEKSKSFQSLAGLLQALLKAGIRRDDRLIAVGGGTVQDITAFIASILFRGIAWEFVPTTLLAQADSCIGSKSSINLGAFKNQIGTFSAPQRVYLIHTLLETLSRDQIRSGLGEIIKLHLIAGGQAYSRAKSFLNGSIPESSQLSSWVQGSLLIKKSFIEEDEFDRGRRNLLNYGHTFGHAYESVTGYKIPHGISVLLGIASATCLSEEMKMTPPGSFLSIYQWLYPYFTPFQKCLKNTSMESLVRAMKRDKKNSPNRLNLILTRGPGRMEKVSLDENRNLRPFFKKLKRLIFQG